MKKLTINEIAEQAGVSKTTVSFYLNGKTNKMSEETQQRIQQIIDETGYEPSAAARAMKAKSSVVLGVILDDVSKPYEAQALKGIEETARAAGYQILIGNSGLNFNNEKEYNTSEKSARYTRMKDIEPRQNALYDKWVNIFEQEIKKMYPNGSSKFFDENGKKARKLAQENARYLISVFTPTNMVYSTSFRQLNYLCHWFEDEIKQPSNNFYASIVPSMQEFVDFCKDKNLFSDKLDDRKDRTLSLFDEPVLKTIYSSNYQGVYKMSFACLAQEQRHRTIDYSINKFTFVNDFSKITEFYIPPIIAGNERLRDEYLKDIATVAEFLPQGTLLDVSEAGSYKNFILKAKERLCACAQKEIRDLTLVQTKEYANALDDEAETFASEETRKQARRMSNKLTSMSNGSRCRAGYKCKSPCGFIDGINLESLV